MASKSQLKDGFAEIIGKENYSRGVIVRQEDDLLHIDMYIIVSYGTKISEIAHNVQSQVKYNLNKSLGLDIDRSEEHTSELQSRGHLVCRLLLEKKKKKYII